MSAIRYSTYKIPKYWQRTSAASVTELMAKHPCPAVIPQLSLLSFCNHIVKVHCHLYLEIRSLQNPVQITDIAILCVLT